MSQQAVGGVALGGACLGDVGRVRLEQAHLEESRSATAVRLAGVPSLQGCLEEVPAAEEGPQFEEVPVAEEGAQFQEVPAAEEGAQFDQVPAAGEGPQFEEVPTAW